MKKKLKRKKIDERKKKKKKERRKCKWVVSRGKCRRQIKLKFRVNKYAPL